MCCDTCAKILLILVNFIFVLLGLGMLVVGCMIRYGVADFLNENVMKILGTTGATSMDTEILDFGSLVGTAALVLIIAGTIIFAIGFLGMCGACCTVRWMLLLYAVLIGLIVLIQVIGIIVFFAMLTEVETFIKTSLKSLITDQYAGYSSKDAGSVAWNYIFSELDCCGVENYTDIYSATNWNRTFIRPDNQDRITLVTPITCCKDIGTFPDYTAPSNYDCVETPTTAISNYDQACYDKLKELIVSVGGYFIGIGVAVLLIEILLMVCAILLYRSEQNKVHPTGYPRY